MKKTITKFTLLLLGMLLVNVSIEAQELQCIISLPSGDISVPVGSPASDFGGVMEAGESVSGVVVPVMSDPTGDNTAEMGCDTIVNGDAVMGNVALIQRGGCFFSDKVYRAQNVGAIAAVICNHTPGAGVLNMGSGGDYAGSAVIPSGFISYEDCAMVTAAIENGDEVRITLRKPNLYNGVSAFAKQTPLSQILPLDSLSVSFSNTGDTIIPDALFTLNITAPNGDVFTSTNGGEIPAASAVSAGFESYTPEELGRYEVEFFSNVTADTIRDFFMITEHTWALDDDSFEGTAGVSNETFVMDGSKYDMGSYYLTGDAGAIVTHAGFAIGNAAEIATGNPDADAFTMLLYKVGPDVAGNTSTYDGFFELVGFGFTSIDGTEAQDEVQVVQLDDQWALEANEDYLMVVSYDGSLAGTGICPRYTTGGASVYPLYGTTVFTDRLYMGGFIGGPNGVVRMYEEGEFEFVKTENVFLDKSKIALSPNPVSTSLNVNFDLDKQAEQVDIRIINIQGQTLKRQTLENVFKGDYKVDVSTLAAGSYVLLTTTPEGRSATQFAVAK